MKIDSIICDRVCVCEFEGEEKLSKIFSECVHVKKVFKHKYFCYKTFSSLNKFCRYRSRECGGACVITNPNFER